MKTYDGMFIFPASLDEAALTQAVEKVKGEITRVGGVIAEATVLGRRSFSRLMKKQESGTYARMRFDLDPAMMAQLLSRLKMIESLFRQQIVEAEPVMVVETPDAKPE